MRRAGSGKYTPFLRIGGRAHYFGVERFWEQARVRARDPEEARRLAHKEGIVVSMDSDIWLTDGRPRFEPDGRPEVSGRCPYCMGAVSIYEYDEHDSMRPVCVGCGSEEAGRDEEGNRMLRFRELLRVEAVRKDLWRGREQISIALLRRARGGEIDRGLFHRDAPYGAGGVWLLLDLSTGEALATGVCPEALRRLAERCDWAVVEEGAEGAA